MTRYCTKCGQPTSQQRPHLYICTNDHQNFIDSVPSSVVYILDGNRVLFGIRSREPGIGKLDPPGGFIEIPENAEEAAVREIKEELGIDIEIKDFLGTYHSIYSEGGQDVLNIVFVATKIGGKFKPGDDLAGGEPVWRSIDDLPIADELSFDWLARSQQDLQNWYKKHHVL